MSKLRITKEFCFEMAHALTGYDGPCRNLHGHSYRLSVTLSGPVNTDKESPACGMVLDFSEIKRMVGPIISYLDHATMLNTESSHETLSGNNPLFQKLILVDYQPTCENILLDISERIRKQLAPSISLHHLKLQETPSSFAEWYKEDNQSQCP